MNLPLVVATPNPVCTALLALRAEGLEPRVELCTTPLAYGQLLTRLWQQGGFMLVEWDIAPWPGALARLDSCPNDVCVHQYYFWLSDSEFGYGYSLGCIKFSERFVREHPIDERIAETEWPFVDSLFWSTQNPVQACIHHPGVAHARQR